VDGRIVDENGLRKTADWQQQAGDSQEKQAFSKYWIYVVHSPASSS
jgi:hypothetical protein